MAHTGSQEQAVEAHVAPVHLAAGTSGSPAGDFVIKYMLSCCAATVAETATYPLDLTKTRLQIQGERNSVLLESSRKPAAHLSAVRRGMLRTGVDIVRNEGVLSLWSGVLPAVLRHYVYTGCRMTVYEYLRESVFRHKPGEVFPFWKAMVCGVVCGALAQFVASPTDLVKVQMQMEGIRKLKRLPPRVTSMWHAFSQVVKEGGVLALYKGVIPNCQRAALVNMADLATYDKVKHLLLRHTSMRDDYTTHTASSVCSGLAAAVASTPADVVKTRVMNQPTDPNTGRGLLYKSSMDCLVTTVRAEGVLALYKGFVPIWSRMAPWSIIFWVSYERVRALGGASSF